MKIEKMEMSIEAMENFAGEKNLEIIDSESENIYYLKSKRAKNPSYEISIIEEKKEEKEKQIHISRDRDIKIVSGKVGDINVKMIYHREKSGEKQFRIFLAQKIDGKLKRTRYITEELKKIQKDEKEVRKIYDSIIAGKIKIKVA